MFTDQNVFIVLFLLLGMAVVGWCVGQWKGGSWGYGGLGCVVLAFLIVILKVFGHAS